MVDGISEEIQQLIADYANGLRWHCEQRESYEVGGISMEECADSALAERQTLAKLHIALAELTENAECQKLERESAEHELLDMRR